MLFFILVTSNVLSINSTIILLQSLWTDSENNWTGAISWGYFVCSFISVNSAMSWGLLEYNAFSLVTKASSILSCGRRSNTYLLFSVTTFESRSMHISCSFWTEKLTRALFITGNSASILESCIWWSAEAYYHVLIEEPRLLTCSVSDPQIHPWISSHSWCTEFAALMVGSVLILCEGSLTLVSTSNISEGGV